MISPPFQIEFGWHIIQAIALSITLILASLLVLRPVFSSLYGPLIRIYNYYDSNHKRKEISKSVFRVFATYAISTTFFAFGGALSQLIYKYYELGFPCDELLIHIQKNIPQMILRNGAIDIYAEILTPIAKSFELLAIVGVIAIATSRILAVLYNTNAIAEILKLEIATIGIFGAIAAVKIDMLTTLSQALRASIGDAPLIIITASLSGFFFCELLLYITTRLFRKVRTTPFFLQRQRKELFELQEQFFSRSLLIKSWSQIIPKEIELNGLSEICWLTFDYDQCHVDSIVNAFINHKLKVPSSITASTFEQYDHLSATYKNTLKTSIKIITTAQQHHHRYHNSSFSNSRKVLDPNKVFTCHFVQNMHQPTFIIINRSIVLVELPCPHERVPHSTDAMGLFQSSNVAFVSRDLERVFYYLNRFEFEWHLSGRTGVDNV